MDIYLIKNLLLMRVVQGLIESKIRQKNECEISNIIPKPVQLVKVRINSDDLQKSSIATKLDEVPEKLFD